MLNITKTPKKKHFFNYTRSKIGQIGTFCHFEAKMQKKIVNLGYFLIINHSLHVMKEFKSVCGSLRKIHILTYSPH